MLYHNFVCSQLAVVVAVVFIEGPFVQKFCLKGNVS